MLESGKGVWVKVLESGKGGWGKVLECGKGKVVRGFG